MTTKLLKLHKIEVAHRPTRTMRKVLSKTKEPTADKSRTNVVLQIDCEKQYSGQAARKPESNWSYRSKPPLAQLCPQLYILLIHIGKIEACASFNVIFTAAQWLSKHTAILISHSTSVPSGSSHQIRARKKYRSWELRRTAVYMGSGVKFIMQCI